MRRPIASHRRSGRGGRSAHETNRSATAISERATLPPGPARPRKHLAKAIRDWSHPERVAGERSASVSLVNGAEIQTRSEEHTSELQSPYDLVCRLLLEKKK